MKITNYRQLEVWAEAMALARAVYAAVEHMPKKEEYRLTAQIVRAAISIPANIAEGHTRATRKEYAHFVSIARARRRNSKRFSSLHSRPAFSQPTLSSPERVGRMLTRLYERLKEPRP